MTAFMWAVNGYSKSTSGQATAGKRCSALRGTLTGKRRSSPSVRNPVMLSSPEISDGEETPACYSTTSSVEGSRLSSSERFVLTGEFSSFESDAFVSGSSDREWSPPTEQLADLRSIFERNGSSKRRRNSSPVAIVIDDSSSSESEAKVSTFLPSRKHHQPSYHCLVVSIPLKQIKLKSPHQSESSMQGTPKEVNQASKPAIGEPLTNGGESVLSASSLRGLKTPLCLKLKRTSPSKNYTVISSIVKSTGSSSSPLVTSGAEVDTGAPLTASSAEVDTSAPLTASSAEVDTNAPVAASNGSASSISVVDKLATATCSESGSCRSGSMASSDVCSKPVKTDSVTASSSVVSGACCTAEEDTSKLGVKQVSACAVPVEGHTHPASSAGHSEGSSDFDPLKPRRRLFSRPTIIDDTSTASSELGEIPVSECYPVASSSPNGHRSPPTNSEEGNFTAGSSSTSLSSQQPAAHSRPTRPFSFRQLFSFYPSDLKLEGRELTPVYTLSLKNTDTIPDDHPVYGWTVGQAVENPRKRKKRHNH